MTTHAALGLATALCSVALVLPASARTVELAPAGDVAIAAEIVADGLENPWAIAFLPDGGTLVTERPGRLRLIGSAGLSEPIAGVPDVAARGQGGLLDVAIDPGFADNGLVYLSYSEPGQNLTAGTAVGRGRLVVANGAATLEDFTVLFRQEPKIAAGQHFGSRLVFDAEGRLYVTLGERGQPDLAQDLTTHMGKVVRINTDGSIPADNPFNSADSGGQPEIWSYGHRNPQGAALHPDTGELWTVEHGARGGDEINRPEAGSNQGWPEISYGVNYSGSAIGQGTSAPGMAQPLYYWDPSIAPSGMTFYTGELFPQWQGDIFVGALKDRKIVRLDVDGESVVGETVFAENAFGRIRDVRTGPDGAIWFVTDESNGVVGRIIPAPQD